MQLVLGDGSILEIVFNPTSNIHSYSASASHQIRMNQAHNCSRSVSQQKVFFALSDWHFWELFLPLGFLTCGYRPSPQAYSWLVSISKESCPHDFVERRALILFLITDVQPFQVNSSGGWHIDSLDAAIWNDSTSPSKRKTTWFAYEIIWNRVCYPLKAALHGFRFKERCVLHYLVRYNPANCAGEFYIRMVLRQRWKQTAEGSEGNLK